MYERILSEYIIKDNNELEKYGTWRTIGLLQQWLKVWVRLLEFIAQFGIEIIISLVFVCYKLYQSGPEFIWVFFVLMICLECIVLLTSKKIQKEKYLESWLNNEWTRWVVRIIMEKFEIMYWWKFDSEIQKLHHINDERKLSMRRRAWPTHWLFMWPHLVSSLFALIIFGVWWYFVIQWKLSLSDLVLLSALMALMDSVIKKILQITKRMIEESASVQKMRDVLDSIWNVEWYEVWDKFIIKNWSIEVNSLQYWYKDWESIYDDLSLSILWWTKTALVWPSGSWKSTLVKLLIWYIRPDSWTIFVDNQDLGKVSLKSYYGHIGYLTQEPSVFDGSVRENLLYWVDAAEDSSIEKVIRLAKCEFVYELVNGLDTQIWERWIRLSWWQRQRLAIAKIFLKNPEIIILDEPTSALDSFSEEAVTQAMNELFKDRTVIIIAHRLQTVKHADDIIVLDEWTVIERWTHTQLVAQWWSYAKMLELQSGF